SQHHRCGGGHHHGDHHHRPHHEEQEDGRRAPFPGPRHQHARHIHTRHVPSRHVHARHIHFWHGGPRVKQVPPGDQRHDGQAAAHDQPFPAKNGLQRNRLQKRSTRWSSRSYTESSWISRLPPTGRPR